MNKKHLKFAMLAKVQIAKNGEQMKFAKVIDTGEYDYETGTSKKEYIYSDFVGVKTNPTRQEVVNGVFSKDTIIILVAGGNIPVPSTIDFIVINEYEYDIVSIEKVEPADVTVLYKIAVMEKGKVE